MGAVAVTLAVLKSRSPRMSISPVTRSVSSEFRFGSMSVRSWIVPFTGPCPVPRSTADDASAVRKAPVTNTDYAKADAASAVRSEEHTSELQSQFHIVCRLLLEKKKKTHN